MELDERLARARPEIVNRARELALARAALARDEHRRASDAQWSGLYDRMFVHMPDETERRLRLAATFGHCADA